MIKCTKCGYVFPGEVCPACGARACAEKKTPLQKPPEEHIALSNLKSRRSLSLTFVAIRFL